MKVEDLKVGNQYLIRWETALTKHVFEIEILDITKTCFKYCKHNTDNSTQTFWEEKYEFSKKYAILEDITKPTPTPQKFELSKEFKGTPTETIVNEYQLTKSQIDALKVAFNFGFVEFDDYGNCSNNMPEININYDDCYSLENIGLMAIIDNIDEVKFGLTILGGRISKEMFAPNENN